MGGASPTPPRWLRRLAGLIVRGPDAPWVLGDLEEAYERDLARGRSPARARRRYLKNAAGSALSLARARFPAPRFLPSLIDVTLGLRMVRKQPALTAVAVFALSMGIPVGLIPFHIAQVTSAGPPFEEGERIVTVRQLDVEHSRYMPRLLRDYDVWRRELTTFEAIGAAMTRTRNAVSEDGHAAPVQGSAVTASVFEIVRVAPLMGRTLQEADERPGAPDVVVISHDFWHSRLGDDPEVLGRTIRIGGAPHEVVGVMPGGFLFPDRDHFWIPLRANPVDHAWAEGPWLNVFGRLADGVTLAQANVELSALGGRIAAEHPDTHRYLRGEAAPFANDQLYRTPTFWIVQSLALLLLTVACGNVGTLVLARTATRSGEIAVRTALGASRARVVGQLFIESLLLALLGAGAGLGIGHAAASRLQASLEQWGLPFWFDFGLTWRTAIMALGLAAFSATVAGVLPALKATGRGVQQNLQRASAGLSGVRFGGLSTALIVAEVAVATAFLSIGGQMLPSVLQNPEEGMGIAPEEYLSATLDIPATAMSGTAAPPDTLASRMQVRAIQQELLRRLAAEPAVRGVALASSLPGEDHRIVSIEVEGTDTGPQRVRFARVDVDFFRGLGQPVLSGRGFERADVASAASESRNAIIVNTSFIEDVLQGRNALGHRVRYAAGEDREPGPWLEIVGVVGHLGMNEINPDRDAGFYHPAASGELNPVRMAIRVGEDPASFSSELRRLASTVDVQAMIRDPRSLEENAKLSETRLGTFWMGGVLVPMIAAVAIVLSAAGLYALVSFTVSARRREIGIRTALGARTGNIVITIARRSFLQLTLGVAAGLVLRLLMETEIGLTNDSTIHAIGRSTLFAGTAAATLAIGLLACVPPLLRALRIRPVDVLKEV